MRFQLQTNRSRNLLGVRSSDWYQTKALGLYFLFDIIFFVFRKLSVSKVGENKPNLDQISHQLTVSDHWQMWVLARAEQYIAEYQISEIRSSRVLNYSLEARAHQI